MMPDKNAMAWRKRAEDFSHSLITIPNDAVVDWLFQKYKTEGETKELTKMVASAKKGDYAFYVAAMEEKHKAEEADGWANSYGNPGGSRYHD